MAASDGMEPTLTFPADRRAWMAVAILTVAIALIVSSYKQGRVQEAPVHSDVTDRYRLTILGYGRIVEQPDGMNIPASMLHEHIEALQSAGFAPVSLDQVVKAYAGGEKLPRRSVLLTFDGGFLSTYQAADPVLRRAGWPAVMFLDTSRQASRDTTYLYWDRLRTMVHSEVWQLGTRAFRAGSISDDGDSHRHSSIETEIDGYKVIATTVMDAGLEHQFQVGVQNDVFGVNGPDADLRRLVRLSVSPGWSGKFLSKRVASAVASPPTRGESSAALPSLITGLGKILRDRGTLYFKGERGAEAWLTGSNWAADWELTARLFPEEGQFWIVSESLANGRRWVWGGDKNGLYFQERLRGVRPRQISRAERAETEDGWHQIRLVKRGSGLHVEWDGTPIKGSPMQLPWSEPGKVALVTAAVGEGAPRLRVTDFHFGQLPFLVEAVDADPSSAQIRKAVQSVDTIAALSPQWFHMAGTGKWHEAALNQDLLAILRRTYQWQIYPAVEITNQGAPSDPIWCEKLAERVLQDGWDGCRLILAGSSKTAGASSSAFRNELEQALNNRGLRLVLATEPPSAGGALP